MHIIKISSDFSKTPGARHKSEGAYPGEEFRDQILIPKYKEAIEAGEKLVVDLDGCYGYATSFLEESFGGMVRILKEKNIMKNIELISKEDETLVKLINDYVREAEALL